MPSIFIKDDLRASVEAATGGRVTVLYTASGQPSYMNVIPKFNLQDIDASLGNGVHPAFIVGGVEKSEIFIGQFAGVVKNGELLSLPGVDPSVSRGHDDFVNIVRANGAGWHLMTNAEWAAIALWCWKNGFQPRGNTNFGKSSDAGWETGRRYDGGTPGSGTGNARTLTGSGPVSWRHDNTASGIADLSGNVWEWAPGLRLVDGEIQIITNNDAALTGTDLSANSAAWKAIKASDGTLVAPGSAGTLKYDATAAGNTGQHGNPQLSDVVTNMNGNAGDSSASAGFTSGAFEAVAAKAGIVPSAILKVLGLYPVAANGLGGDVLRVRNYGERVAARGGLWYYGTESGVFAAHLGLARAFIDQGVGARPAYVL